MTSARVKKIKVRQTMRMSKRKMKRVGVEIQQKEKEGKWEKR